MTHTSANDETFSVFISHNSQDEYKKSLLESLIDLFDCKKEEQVLVFVVGTCSAGKSDLFKALTELEPEQWRLTAAHELGHWRHHNNTNSFGADHLRAILASCSFDDALASPGAALPLAQDLYSERLAFLHFASHGAVSSRDLIEMCQAPKGSENDLDAFHWTPASRLGFFLNRYLSYPQNRMLRYGEGLRELGGLAHAFDLAWTDLYQTMYWRAENGAEVPTLSNDREGSLFSWATTLAHWHGCEVTMDEERGLDACLIQTAGRSVIHLSKHLGIANKTHFILHELAHLVLGHVHNTQYGLDPRLLAPSALRAFQKQEKTADALASCWTYMIEGLYDILHNLIRRVSLPLAQASSLQSEGSALAEKISIHCASP